jgi:para-aminobenzoate synthetase/4-amino-4-deoxychorismate lyase
VQGDVTLRDAGSDQWLRFAAPCAIVTTTALADVLPALARVEAWVEERGGWAAGFIAYEAAPAFDAAQIVLPAPDFPLLWFGLYDAPAPVAPPAGLRGGEAPVPQLVWQPSVSRSDYDRAIARIREHIGRGETYQLNYTMRLRATLAGGDFERHARDLFAQLVRAQPASHAAFVDTGRHVIASASPELFLARDGARLVMRPMKGTAPRGRHPREDRARAEALRDSAKNRAENIMILDMVRNDLGRIAVPGSVVPQALWTIERHPTVWQMTSAVEARSDASFVDVLRATFPCASITGAPKVRTMQIIAGLEAGPRRIYTGAIGFLAPGRRAQFSVAIRTALLDREAQSAEYGVGGGIVWDSEAGDEYEETRHKARVLTLRLPELALIESLRWTPEEGCWLLDRHLARLAGSAGYFDFPFEAARAHAALTEATAALPAIAHKLRLTLDADGGLAVSAEPLGPPRESVRLVLAPRPVDANDRFLFHKTTVRDVYDAAWAERGAADDVLLWNARGELTETCIANIVLQLGDELLTPPVDSGLLAGTYRAALLDEGRIRERVLTLADLERATAVFRINSVRGWQRAVVTRGA